jgi:hypothetical protein
MARIKNTAQIEGVFRGERPKRPPPLDVNDRQSRAAWRQYMTDCALADNPRLRPPEGERHH